MDLGLKGRRALVMGASKGLGRAIAESLAEEGVALVVSGRRQQALDECAAGLRGLGAPAATGVVADVDDAEQMTRLNAAAEGLLGGVDIVVLNHGGPPPGHAVDMTEDALSTWFRRMVLAPIGVATRLLPGMRSRGWGRILTVGSSGMVPILTSISVVLPSRTTVRGTDCPGFRSATLRDRSRESEISLPSTFRMVSPCWTPAARAGCCAS
jgi:3-oxoacyl-[acyl-carrier protein] reductase